MTFAILIIGFACIVYAQRARKDEMDFKEILDNSDFEIENSESFPLDNGVAYVDIKNMEKKLELF
ncbi:MAG: hypothetical protein C0604_04065 [Clostridiales bacterium]|nr:MAG: hypothetical protein C0604_04065 [Clostridiales bacterium]